MNILVAIDKQPYSTHTVEQVAALAKNTWANVTILGVQSGKIAPDNKNSSGMGIDKELLKAVRDYRERFLSCFDPNNCPYTPREFGYEIVEITRGVYEDLLVSKGAIKELRSKVREGNPTKAILAESLNEGSDLIILGCNRDADCIWEDGVTVPQKVANEAVCSVLVLKEGTETEKIICCLDHDRVSQQSLEMINQMVTLYNAQLEIIGLTNGEELKPEVEKKIEAILKYYSQHGTEAILELVELHSLSEFIVRKAHQGLMALWMGKKSILENIFTKSRVTSLLKNSKSSVLLLR